MSRVVLIRHVETAMAGRFCGHSDPEPSLSGESQIFCMVKKVQTLGIQRIVSSDLRRTAHTARAIGERISVTVEFRPELREAHFGLWEGLSWNEIEKQFPAEAKCWAENFPLYASPGGEPYTKFTERIERALAQILTEARERTTAIVTHRGVLQYALPRFFGVAEADARTATADYGTIIVAQPSNSGWKIRP